MERFIVMLLLAAAPGAQAQHVYKCSSTGVVSYQSEPCTGTPDRVWHAPPEVIGPAIQRQNQYTQREMDQRTRAQRSGYRQPSRATGAAKRLGTRRTFEQSRLWDNRVYDACR